MCKIKIAPSIIAEKGIEKKVSLYLENNGNEEFETLYDLLEQINKDLEYANIKGHLNRLLNTPVTLQLVDIYGQIVEGRMTLSVGEVVEGRMTLSVGEVVGGNFILTGNIEGVYFLKNDKK